MTADLGVCQSGYCDRPAVAYVSRTVGSSRTLTVILGRRAEELGGGIEGTGSPLALRCLDCAHDELDKAIGNDVQEPVTYTVEMPFQRPPLTLNQRMHGAKKGRVTAQLREDVGWAIRGARVLRCNGVAPRLVTVGLFYAPGDQRERDDDNLVATLKVCADAVVDAGVTTKDTPEFMRKSMPVIVPPPEPGPRCWLTISITQ